MTRACFGENARPACDKKKQQEHLFVLCENFVSFYS